MPTIPLYDVMATAPGAWRCVTAPGGWHRWRLDVVDAALQNIAVISLHDGQFDDRAYQRRYLRFTRSPTRRDPPRPGEYRSVEIDLYLQSGRHTHELVKVDEADFEAMRTELRVRVGNYSIQPTDRDQFRLAGPDVDLTLQPGGNDGSLWQVNGSLWKNAINGTGVLRTDFGTAPRGKATEYRLLLSNRAVVQSFSGERDLNLEVDGFLLQAERRMDRHRSRYDIAGHEGAVAIVDVY